MSKLKEFSKNQRKIPPKNQEIFEKLSEIGVKKLKVPEALTAGTNGKTHKKKPGIT